MSQNHSKRAWAKNQRLRLWKRVPKRGRQNDMNPGHFIPVGGELWQPRGGKAGFGMLVWVDAAGRKLNYVTLEAWEPPAEWVLVEGYSLRQMETL